MKGNIPITELPFNEEVWLMVFVTSVRERRTQQGKPFRDASARNATGSLALKIWAEVLEGREEIKPGLWGVTGKLESFQDRSQFVVTEYRPINIEQYREHVGCDPLLPRAFTMDIETIALPGFRERVGPKLEKDFRLGYMRLEQQERYLEDIAAEEERVYQLGSLNATSGRILSIAVHVGPVPGFELEGLISNQSEHAFGIDKEGNEQGEAQALKDFLALMSDFDIEAFRIPGLTGAHTGRGKVAAIGVHIARWVTTHGFALNVNTDLSYFDLIIACEGEPVTSMKELLGSEIEMSAVEARLVDRFVEVFEMSLAESALSIK